MGVTAKVLSTLAITDVGLLGRAEDEETLYASKGAQQSGARG